MERMLREQIAFAISPAVVLEYEDLLKRPGILGWMSGVTDDDIDVVLDRLCAVGVHSLPWFRFRPFLNDPKDDIYIECALAAGATCIVSDDKHFRLPAVVGFGIVVMTASEFVEDLRLERTPW